LQPLPPQDSHASGDLALPLIGASLAAEFVATALGGRPLYECLLERELAHTP
jgi:hypothetical protein